ncbi:MAG: hypothetical protein Q4P15_12160 [Propionibacteriaceae bacterium]|nr:hypothetical protein [Propionibacteriaceae bacterium]
MRTLLIRITTAVMVISASLGVSQAAALPLAPEPVAPITGIPAPCSVTHEWPGDEASIDTIAAQVTENFGFALTGSQWTESSRESIKILWQTLDGVDCTGYIQQLQAKVNAQVGINAAGISGFAWGDWSLTKANHVTMDFSKFQRALDSGDEGRLVRLVTHEMAHVLNSDRYEDPEYWKIFLKLYAQEGKFSDYASSSTTETFADVVGYYVGRCALENPYDTGKYNAYYEFAKTHVFGGKEFGPAPGEKPNCVVPATGAETPLPGTEAPASWVEAVSGA